VAVPDHVHRDQHRLAGLERAARAPRAAPLRAVGVSRVRGVRDRFSVLVRAELSPITVGRAFYVWSAVFNLFVISCSGACWRTSRHRDARQLYGPIAAAARSRLPRPFLTGRLVGTIGVAGVLVMSAVLLELAVIGVVRVRRSPRTWPPSSQRRSSPISHPAAAR